MKPALPETREALEAAGYQFLNRTRCRACPATIEFWRRVPNAPMPIEELPDGRMVSHFAVCPRAQEFRQAAIKKHVVENRLSKAQEAKQKRAEKLLLKEQSRGPRLFE